MSKFYCSACEEDMSQEDYEAALAAMFPEARQAGVLPRCQSCEDEAVDAWLERQEAGA